MIIELIEEIKPGTGTMYAVKAEGHSVKWFAVKSEAEAFYDTILADPTILEPKINILKSNEIDVSLNKQNS